MTEIKIGTERAISSRICAYGVDVTKAAKELARIATEAGLPVIDWATLRVDDVTSEMAWDGKQRIGVEVSAVCLGTIVIDGSPVPTADVIAGKLRDARNASAKGVN